MKVKKFYGNDNQDVIAKVRGELGSNAVILHQRKVKPKGFLGLFKRPVVEVVAAIEEMPPAPPVKLTTSNIAKTQELRLREQVALKSKDRGLEKEINDIKSMLSTVVNQMENIEGSRQAKNLDNIKDTYIYNMLRENELDEELISIILEDSHEDITNLHMDNKEEIKDFLAKFIPDNISGNGFWPTSKLVFFVGPTGVGKTTTIAKLAANYSLDKGLKVGLISADTYRIAAVEQLKVYSDILNIPLEVIYSPKEIHQAIDKLHNRDIILVDTAGRSHKNNEHIYELRLLLEEVEDKNVYLVVSSTTKNSDLRDILDKYTFLQDYKIIFTKLDEVSSYGSVLNIAMRQPQFLSYITTGQSVPDDIEKVTSSRILDMLLKEF